MRILFLAPTFQSAGGEDLYEGLLTKLQRYSSSLECMHTSECGENRRLRDRPRRSSHTTLKCVRAPTEEEEARGERPGISAVNFREALREFDLVFAAVDVNCTMLGAWITLALAEGKPVVLLRKRVEWITQPSYKLLLDWHKIGGARATLCEYVNDEDVERALASYFMNIVVVRPA